jgi:hypothetical protein
MRWGTDEAHEKFLWGDLRKKYQLQYLDYMER